MTRIRQTVDDPERFQNHLTHAVPMHVQHYTPELANDIRFAVGRKLAYLREQLPAPMSRLADTVTPNAITERYSAHSVAKFARILRAVENPLDVIEDVTKGKLDRDAIEAVEATSPALYEELRLRAMAYASRKRKEIPYPRRVLLGLLFKFPADKSMQKEFILANQAAMSEEVESPPPPKPLSTNNFGESYETEISRKVL